MPRGEPARAGWPPWCPAGEIAPGVLLTQGIRDAYVAGAHRARQEATTLLAAGAEAAAACGATLVRVDSQAE